jgi:stage V sporulation protein R
MKTVMEIVRHTSLYFQPQMRTNIMNEGWASYWHDRLFLQDDRIRGHEVSYARVNAWVTALPKLGLNSYALGMRVFEHLKENADKGKISYDYQRLTNKEKRRHYNREAGNGQAVLLSVRENFGDFNFVNTFIDQEFMDRYKLFVASRRMNGAKGVWEYYIKSRKAEDYRQMLLSSLYHPPSMMIDEAKCTGGCLYLNHEFEGKPLVREYLANTMLGIEYLWGGPVKLETSEPVEEQDQGIRDIAYLFYSAKPVKADTPKEKKYRFQRVVYTMENRQLSMEAL